MPVTFRDAPHSTNAEDRPSRKSGFGIIANALKAAGSDPLSAQRVMKTFPHYGIKNRKIKPVGNPKRIA